MFYMACPAWYMDGCRLPEEGNAVFGFVMEKTRCLGGESAEAPGGLKGRNAMAHILVVDDDADMRALLSSTLGRDGHHVVALSGGAALDERHARWADCVILDVMMPGEDGFAVCRRIRDYVNCPILFLTAKTTEADVLTGLGTGGDDYLTKPFRIAELRARVAAHLRREQRTPSHRIRRGPFAFDMDAHTVYCGEQMIRLTRGEYEICAFLALHAGQTFTKEQIYEAVFGCEGASESAAIAEHIKNIRAKLRQTGHSPLETVWGVGYRWKNMQESAQQNV